MFASNSTENALANGTALTNANSGGTAGTAWDAVQTGTGGAVAVTTTAIRGTRSTHCSTGATSTFARAVWNSAGALGGTFSRLQGRFSVKPNNLTPAQVAVFRAQAGGSQCCRITVDSTGHVTLRNTSSGSVVTSTGTMTTSSKWLISFDITFGSSASGTLYIRYDPANQSPDETIPFSAANFLSTAIDEVDYGVSASTANADVVVDDVILTDSGTVPGSPVVTGSASLAYGSFSLTGAGHRTGNGTVSFSLGAFSLAGSGVATTPKIGSVHFDFGAFALTGSGVDIPPGSGPVVGSVHFSYPGFALAASRPPPVTGAVAFTYPGFVLHGTGAGSHAQYLFTPPLETRTTMLAGSLRVTHQESSTVWKDATGTWRSKFYITEDELAGAQILLAVGGRPQVVSSEVAAELIAAGIGTLVQIT